MNYKLNTNEIKIAKKTIRESVVSFLPLLRGEKKALSIAMVAVVITTVTNLVAPLIIARIVDVFIVEKNLKGILFSSAILLGIYILGSIANYIQIMSMGGVGRRVLFTLRNTLFTKLQSLPISFFTQNKSGDLISRINNDTDKLNQFFSQALVQFIGNFFLILGSGIFLLTLQPRLGFSALIPAGFIFGLTKILSAWLKRTSKKSLQATGNLSAEIQESLSNFKIITAFNRIDYFKKKFNAVNQENYTASLTAGMASNVLTPLYSTAANIAQVLVLAYGIALVSSGQITIGLVISFLMYVNNFYMPLRQIASIWSSFQLSLASLERISEVTALESNLSIIPRELQKQSDALISFNNVSFGYPDGKMVLHDISFELHKGKTYALVGPTGGGKTTIASLLARLFDPNKGKVFLSGYDIRSYSDEERAAAIGFILQDPFIMVGTVRDNIIFGNDIFQSMSTQEVEKVLREAGLIELLSKFEKGLDTEIKYTDTVSLGQRQIIAFIRAIIRKPKILILDEATANIDTVTEEVLEKIIQKLPKETTKIIIAHRLNTIENADEIFFVNEGRVVPAGSFANTLEMLQSMQLQS